MQNETTVRNFDKSFHDIKRSKSLTPFLKQLIHHIYSYNDTEYGCCQTNTTLADLNGMSLRQISYSLQRLADAKILISETKEGRTAKLSIDMDRVLFLISIEHLPEEEQNKLKNFQVISQVSTPPESPVTKEIAKPVAPVPAKSNAVSIADIKAHVKTYAEERGLHPQHKVCSEFITKYQQRISRGEDIGDFEKDLIEVFEKFFPIAAAAA